MFASVHCSFGSLPLSESRLLARLISSADGKCKHRCSLTRSRGLQAHSDQRAKDHEALFAATVPAVDEEPPVAMHPGDRGIARPRLCRPDRNELARCVSKSP